VTRTRKSVVSRTVCAKLFAHEKWKIKICLGFFLVLVFFAVLVVVNIFIFSSQPCITNHLFLNFYVYITLLSLHFFSLDSY